MLVHRSIVGRRIIFRYQSQVAILKNPTIRLSSYQRPRATMPSILFMGISSRDPGFPLPPTVSPEVLDAVVNEATKSMTDAGYAVNLFLPLMAEGIAKLEDDLAKNKYDAIIVGVSWLTSHHLSFCCSFMTVGWPADCTTTGDLLRTDREHLFREGSWNASGFQCVS